MRLCEALYSPEVGYTLISIGRLDEAGFSVTFSDGKCVIRDEEGSRVGQIPRSKAGLYRVVHDTVDPTLNNVAQAASAATRTDEKVSVMELHARMGHIAPAAAEQLVRKGFVAGIKIDDSTSPPTFCDVCTYAKATRKPITKERHGDRAKNFAEEIHSDVWGPAQLETINGKRYFITFTDDHSRLMHMYLLRKKSDAFSAYKTYEAWCKTQRDVPIKVLRSDRGGEYLGKAFIAHLDAAGTHHKLTVHDTPQYNGVAERLNRTLLERARAMLYASGLPKFLWDEAISHAVWL